jgi:uncharacterized membrane-anchored protein YjiN (DUF445 family)
MAEEQDRAGRLRVMRLVATGLLAAMAVAYAVTSCLIPRAPWLGYARAFAEAATVGACADWFAVTALFRRPLGLPIPHTGIIPRNKDRIGDALGAFIADNFLTVEILEAKLRALEIGRWGAEWLRQPGNAGILAARLVELVPELLDLSTPAARRRFVGVVASDVISSLPAASIASGFLRAIWSAEGNSPILDAALDLIARALVTNQDLFRDEVAGRTYRWLPRWLDQKIADRILSAVIQTIEEMRSADHPWRERVRRDVEAFIVRLETDPALGERAEQIKLQIISHPLLVARIGELSDALEARLRPTTEAEASILADRVTGLLAGFGAWLYENTEAVEIFNAWARQAVQRTIAPRRHEVGRLIASVVADWDARNVTDKLELQIGADLQYIRINGTIVGGLVGLLIFTLSRLLGAPA